MHNPCDLVNGDIGLGTAGLALRCLGSFHALDAAVEVFLKTYFSGSRPEVLATLRFFGAATCLKLAQYDVNRRQATLEEGLRILEQGFR